MSANLDAPKKINKGQILATSKSSIKGRKGAPLKIPCNNLLYLRGRDIPQIDDSNIGFSNPPLYIINGNWKIILCQYVSLGSRSTHMYCMFWPQLVNVFLTSSWPLGNWSDYKAFIDNYLYPKDIGKLENFHFLYSQEATLCHFQQNQNLKNGPHIRLRSDEFLKKMCHLEPLPDVANISDTLEESWRKKVSECFY